MWDCSKSYKIHLQMTEQRKQKQRIGLLNNAPSLLNLGGAAGLPGTSAGLNT